MKAVKDVEITPDTDIAGIFEKLADSGGFEATNLASGLDILCSMVKDKECLRMLSFVGAVVSTGLRGVIKSMIKEKMFDVIITTCGALDHDIARSYSEYHAGSFTMDDGELAKKDIHRLGSVLVPMDSYGPLIEKKMQLFLEKEYDSGVRRMTSADIAKMIGSNLGDDSFLGWAARNGVPVVVPGIMDGAVGSQIWMFSQKHADFELDLLGDAALLSGMIFKAAKSGALMIGGGISKHHTLWWNQYRGGLDYALYITTAQEFDGSLSGAEVREAISWGKVAPNARQVTIHAEATAVLPFLYAALLSEFQ